MSVRPRLTTASELHGRGGPALRVRVLLMQMLEVDRDRVPLALHREAVHAARRAPLDERAVGAVLRLVLRALEALVVVEPPERRVLVRARERERVHAPLPAG